MNANSKPTNAISGSSHRWRLHSAGEGYTVGPEVAHPTRLRRHRRRRRGYTLLESLASIAVFAVILIVTSLTLHTIVRADRRIRDDLNLQREFDRLAVQLRSDAHAALTVSIVDGPGDTTADTLQMALPDSQSIQYTLHADRVERTLRREEKTEHHEAYRLSSTAQWQVETERPTAMVSLILKPQTTSQSGGPAFPYECRIDAAVRLISSQPISPEPKEGVE